MKKKINIVAKGGLNPRVLLRERHRYIKLWKRDKNQNHSIL